MVTCSATPGWNIVLLSCLFLSVIHVTTSDAKSSKGLGEGALGIGPEEVDRDILRPLCGVVHDKGLRCEMLNVTTSDGYILGIHHIYHAETSPDRPPVIIAHTFMDSAFSWVLNQRDQSLPYLLADAGFGVYLYNARGNRYSRRHKKYPTNSQRFWDFGWDEMAAFDVIATLNLALTRSNTIQHKTAAWVGHGQGATIVMAALIRQPEMAKKLNLFVSIAPTPHMSGATVQSLRILHEMGGSKYLEVTGVKEFAPSPVQLRDLFKVVCRIKPWQCENVVEALVGPHEAKFNESRLQVLIKHSPGGTSVRNLQKTVQAISSGRFQQFDYGYSSNMKAYQDKLPPLYDFKTFPEDVPVAVYFGGKDKMVGKEDSDWVVKQLGSNVIHSQTVDGYAHMDFAWDYHASKRIYPTIVKQVHRYRTIPATTSRPPVPSQPEGQTDEEGATLVEKESTSKKSRMSPHPYWISFLIVAMVGTTVYGAYLLGSWVREQRLRANHSRTYELLGTPSL
eukprot:TRINITY_DN853_c0_g5_i1.p1 TRINITY_DN853_c0_g5~~TRINITY_DN853_c0_g5_i1.p1  ORF type:complete len:507 (-),score=61.27 TRINITY_DN853_c0_g5_i1:76-1596(-)